MAVAVAGVVRTTAAQALPHVDGPSPETVDGYQYFVEVMHKQEEAYYARVIGYYDDFLREHPKSSRAAVERCQFALAVLAETAEVRERSPAEDEGDCAGELEARFPNEPAALLLRLEHLWGDEATEFAKKVLARDDIPWTDHERAEFLKRTADHYSWLSQHAEAAKFARQARAYDPVADVGIVLATHYQVLGLREEAIREVVHHARDPKASFQRISMLLELEAYAEALLVVDEVERAGETVDAMSHARALEGVGRTTEARTKYEAMPEQTWNRNEVLTRLFYIDLAQGDEDRAVAAYDALAVQEGADPYFRHRLALAFTHPFAPWKLRDLLGASKALGYFVLTLLVPLVVLLPIHYVGLLRRARGTLPPAGDVRWSLRHVYGVFAALLVVELVCLYVFAPEGLDVLFAEYAQGTEIRQDALANYGVASILLGFAGVLAITRRGKRSVLLRSRWSRRRTFAMTLLCSFAFYVVTFLTLLVGRALELEAFAPRPAASLTTLEMIRSVLRVHGAGVLFPLAAVLVPVYEEIAFRGVFLTAASRYLPAAVAIVVQATVFMLMHDEVAHYVPFFALALMAAVMTRRAGGLGPAIALHMTVNFIACTAVWSLDRMTRSVVRGVERDDGAPSNRALEQRCDRSERAACVDLGLRYLDGDGVSQDDARAASLFRRACDAESPSGCSHLAHLYFWGRGVEQNDATSVDLLHFACDRDVPKACAQLGWFYGSGRGIDRDLATAAKLNRKACDGGDGLGCAQLGVAVRDGAGVGQDVSAAVPLLEKACRLRNGYGCFELGWVHKKGQGVEPDLGRAVHFLREGCNLGHAASCNDLGVRHELGEGVARDDSRAALLYEEACNDGIMLACRNLAELLDEGRGLARDSVRAAALRQRACEGGIPSACVAQAADAGTAAR